MCNLFVNAESDMWESRTKSLRISGFVTSVRMENYFWRALEEIAERTGSTVNELVSTLYSEAMSAGHSERNFTSFVRVCAIRYYSLVARGEISPTDKLELDSLPTTDILSRESERWHKPGLMPEAKAG